MTAHEPPLPPCTPVWRIGGTLRRADIPALCDRLRIRIHGTGATVIVCDVARASPDGVTVEALARLQLTARRLGRRIRLRGASAELLDLLGLTGLRGVLPLCPEPRANPSAERDPLPFFLRREPGWQPEQREQPFGVEEEVQPSNPAA